MGDHTCIKKECVAEKKEKKRKKKGEVVILSKASVFTIGNSKLRVGETHGRNTHGLSLGPTGSMARVHTRLFSVVRPSLRGCGVTGVAVHGAMSFHLLSFLVSVYV